MNLPAETQVETRLQHLRSGSARCGVPHRKMLVRASVEGVCIGGVGYAVNVLSNGPKSEIKCRDAARRLLPSGGRHLGSAPYLSSWCPRYCTTPQLYRVPGTDVLYATAVSEKSQFADILLSLVPI